MLFQNTTLDGAPGPGQPLTVLDMRHLAPLVVMQPGAVFRFSNLQLQGTCTRTNQLDPRRNLTTLMSSVVWAVQGQPTR